MKFIHIIVSVLAFGLSVFAAEPSQRQSFEVNYVGGPAIFEQTVRLSFTTTALVIEGKGWRSKPTKYLIPLAAITRVVHSPTRFGRHEKIGPLLPAPTGGVGGPGAGGYALMYLVALGISSTMHGQSHYVSVIWTADGVDQELLIEPHKDNYQTLLRQFETVTPGKILDLATECKKVEDELRRQKDKAFLVKIDRRVQVGDSPLPPGVYKAVLLERAENSGELYFFDAEIRNDLLRAVSPVKLEPGVGATEVVYASETRPVRIERVRTPERTLLLLSEK